MPKYYIDTFDGLVVIDDVGHDLPDRTAVREMVKRTLSEILRDEKADPHRMQFRADVRDESGVRIMTATLLMVIDEQA